MQEFVHKIIFALIAGFSEFLPVSASAHQVLYQYVTNCQMDPPLLLAVHLGCLIAALVCCRKRMKWLHNERKLAGRLRRGRGRQANPVALMDAAILKTAMIPILLGALIYRSAAGWINSVAALALMLMVNGIILFIPLLLGRSNKDGRSLSRMDGLLIGIGELLGFFPGLSRIGCAYSIGIARGADQSYTVETVLMLSIPALAVLVCFDIYAVATVGAALTVIGLLSYFSAAALAFCSSCLTIALLRYFSGKADILNFAYYSWGLALFSFLIYLIIH